KEMTTSYISWQGGELEHIDFQVLREGHILNTALAKIPGITTIFPKKLLYLFEEKWLSLSKLTINGKTYQGWSIHEKVTF
ncbi:MAG: hypothetical protein U9N49_04060, partial [Campylobacterota bacterium]|nr:hypothetical protein [Campylobacterota bacterium]